MDVTSGAAVAALLFDLYDVGKVAAVPEKQNEQIQKHDAQIRPLRVLDLCCAPGYVSFLSLFLLSLYNNYTHTMAIVFGVSALNYA